MPKITFLSRDEELYLIFKHLLGNVRSIECTLSRLSNLDADLTQLPTATDIVVVDAAIALEQFTLQALIQSNITPIMLVDEEQRGVYEEKQIEYITKDELNTRLLELTLKRALESQLNESLQLRLTTHDHMTGLYNRQKFEALLTEALNRARAKRTALAVLYFKLNQFKHINELLGHSSGDIVLKMVAHRIQGCLRKHNIAANFGGNCFVILLNNMSKSIDAANMADNISEALEKPLIIKGRQLLTSCSMGIAFYPNAGETQQELIEHARLAMLEAKKLEHIAYQYFTPELQKIAERHHQIELTLADAIDNQELSFVYQPQYHISDQTIAGIECLLRWQHNALGEVSADEIIAAAVKSDLVYRLGEWVVTQAIHQYQNFAQFAIKLSFNLTATDLLNPSIVPLIYDSIHNSNVDPSKIIVELTEGILIDDPRLAIEILNQLNDIGVAIAIDDYGSGYSSLAYLKDLPASIIKLDASLMQGIPADKANSTIVRSTVELIHELGLLTLVEGIETQQQLDFIKQLPCDLAQGYFLSRPLSKAQLLAVLQQFP